MLCCLVCQDTVVELGQVLDQGVPVLPHAEGHGKQVSQSRGPLHEQVVEGLAGGGGLLHAGVHADADGGGGLGALLEGLHHADVVDRPFPLLHLFTGQLLEHSPVHCLLEHLVELLHPLLLHQPLLLGLHAGHRLKFIILENLGIYGKGVGGSPLLVLGVVAEVVEDGLVLRVLLEGQHAGPELALLALLAGSAAARHLHAHGFC